LYLIRTAALCPQENRFINIDKEPVLKDNFIEDDEILEMAVAREVDAIKFYTMLANTGRYHAIRKLFESLAAEEMEHKAKLEFEIMKTGRVVDTQRVPAIFTDKPVDFVPPQIGDYKDVLNIGLKKEDTSFQL
jgi:hypothetical protein